MKASHAGGRRGLMLLAAASLMATAACGSTVQQTGAQSALGGGALASDGSAALAGDGLGVAGAGPGAAGATTKPDLAAGAGSAEVAAGSTFTGSSGGAASPGAGAAGGGSAAGPAGGPAGTQGAAGAAPAAAGKNGPGVTAKEIFIGIAYTANGDQANAALGAAISRGDERQNARAVIDDINEKGGVAGRKLVPVFHGYDAQSTETSASQDQAACATFTQDNKVFAVTSVGITETFAACMKKAGVLQITTGSIIFHDREYMRQFPSFFHQRLSQERMMAELVRSFQRQDYFSGWDTNLAKPAPGKAKLGIISLDTPTFNRPLDKVMLPSLARAGHAVESSLVYRVHRPATNAEAGQTAADIQSATLRFRDAGVTHVVMFDASAFLTLTFLNTARNQRYFPRLGANSGSGLQALKDSGAVDSQQLTGALGLGWMPTLDLPKGAGDQYLTAETKKCLDNNKKRTGQTFTSTNAASIALSPCDSIGAIAAAVRKAGPVINFDTGLAAMEALGGSLRPAGIPKVFFGPGRHDGAEFGFDLFWDSACTCAKYRDKGRRVPS
jgi:hypothetical protein